MHCRHTVILLPVVLLTAGCGRPEAAVRPTTAPATKPAPKDDSVLTGHIRDATTPMRRGDSMYQNQHASFVARAKQGGVDLVFVGDSITAGWAGKGKAIWAAEYAPHNAANFGIVTDMTQFLLWRLGDGELEGISPKAVVLMIGTNNLKSGPTRMPPAAVAAGVAEVVKLLRTKLPDSKVLLCGVLPRQPKYDWMPAAVVETNKLLARLDDGRHVRFLDFAAKYLNADASINASLFCGDLLHLNGNGYRVWADEMGPLLGELMK